MREGLTDNTQPSTANVLQASQHHQHQPQLLTLAYETHSLNNYQSISAMNLSNKKVKISLLQAVEAHRVARG
jgi:hypothetical protein